MRKTGIQPVDDFDEAFIEVERRILENQPFEVIESRIDSWLLTEDERSALWFLLHGSTEGREVLVE